MNRFSVLLGCRGFLSRWRWGRVVGLLLLCSFWGVIDGASSDTRAADVELLTPRSGSKVIARGLETHLVLRQKGAGGASRVREEKTGTMLDPVVSMAGEEFTYLHFRLPLTPGINRFTIMPGGQQVELDFQRVQATLNLKAFDKNVFLFHQDDKLPKGCEECHDLQATETIKPVGLTASTSCLTCHKNLLEKDRWKHSPAVNQECLICHLQSAKPWRIGFPVVEVQDICLGCHTGMKARLTQKFVHGPIVVGGCTACHNPHGAKYRYYTWTEGSLSLCIACHTDKKNLVSAKDRLPYVHGIITGKGCVACHDPHATDEKFMLVKPINELCVGCHPFLAGVKRGHPVANHPVSAPVDPMRPTREFVCTSCHNPHGSYNQYMLFETKVGSRLCHVCHKR